MEAIPGITVTRTCPACHRTAAHHPFAKPRCPDLGLVCARCGHVIHPSVVPNVVENIDMASIHGP